MSNISKRRREGAKTRTLGDNREFLKRISKSLYYGKLSNFPCVSFPCLSLPVTEISAELFSEAQRGRSLKRLHIDEAAKVTRNACVSPCSLVLAILYLERLKTTNPDYLAKIAPSELFLVSLMVSNKILHDDGEENDVFSDEWAAYGGIDITTLKLLEKNFLNAIDWRLYVSEESFESGLSWLERQVALKQVNLRGFFTYTDLVSMTGDVSFGELVKSVSSLCLAATLGYLASLLTIVASTLLISNSLVSMLNQETSISKPVNTNCNVLTPMDATENINATGNRLADNELDITLANLEKIMTTQEEINKMSCCTHIWDNNEKYHDGITLDVMNTMWWHKSAFDWLHDISILAPLQEWLDKFNKWNEKIAIDLLNFTNEDFLRTGKTDYRKGQHSKLYENERYNNLWLNLGQFNYLISVADR